MSENKSRYIDWAFCFSLPMILMLKNWNILVFRNSNTEYFGYQPNAFSYLGALLLVTAMAFITALGLRFYRRSGNNALVWILRFLFLASFLVVLGFLREHQQFGLNGLNALRFRFGAGIDFAFLGAFGLIGLAGLYYMRFIARAAFVFVVLLTPFGLGIAAQAGWAAAHSKLPEARSAGAEPVERKVVLLLFDELDTRVLFEQRPEGWQFPAFDRLRSEALYAPNASAPGGSTIRAIPALLTGKAVTKSTVRSGPELDLLFADGDEARFGEIETVFHRVDKLGLKSSVVGFHHPYCQLFAAVLTECHRLATGSTELEPPRNILVSMKRQLLGLSVLHFRQAAIASYKIIRDRGIRLAGHGDSDFVFIHATVPHYPPIYDAQKAAFTMFNLGATAYIDNVALADRFLADLRQELEEDGTWDDVTLIVTSDHGWRDGRYHYGDDTDKVPFLVKLPNQTKGTEYASEVSALVIANLVVEAVTGRIREPQQLIRWLRREQASRRETAWVN